MKKYIVKMPVVKYVEFETYANNEDDAIERIGYGDWEYSNENWEEAEVMVDNYFEVVGHNPINDIVSVKEAE